MMVLAEKECLDSSVQDRALSAQIARIEREKET